MDSRSDRDRVLTIKGIHTELWGWLKGQSGIERKTLGEVLNELIARYRVGVESTDVRLRGPVRPRNTHGDLAIRGLDLELLTWARDHARLNRITAGDIVNDAIEWYKTAVEQYGEALGGPSLGNGELVVNSVNGIDRRSWEYLKDRAAVEEMTMGEMINELLARYRWDMPMSPPSELEQCGESPGGCSLGSGELATTTVKGVDRQLWGYLKDRAAVENMTMGEMVNELIARYRWEGSTRPSSKPEITTAEKPDISD